MRAAGSFLFTDIDQALRHAWLLGQLPGRIRVYEHDVYDGALLARLSADEVVAGTWTFNQNLIWKSGTSFKGTLDHANTADRVYTMQDAAGTVPLWGDQHDKWAGLTDDDHAQYALLAGRAGGQLEIGGTAASEDLKLQSTSHATRGDVEVGQGADGAMLASATGRVGFFGTAPQAKTAVADLAAGTAGGAYGVNEQTMLQAVYDKMNGLLNALQALGVV
mgnify:CR=1 FL=1